MHLEDIWELLAVQLFDLPSTLDGHCPLFNPYRDEVDGLEAAGAAQIRRANLRTYLESFPTRPGMLVVGEALGWRGGRFSGLPLVSEALLLDGRPPFEGKGYRRTSLDRPLLAESTATIFWRAARPHFPDFLTWNCLPLHPHRPGQPLSNRTPTAQEVAIFQGMLYAMIELLQPRLVVGMGKNAARALQGCPASLKIVRHPSHGGARQFEAGMRAVWEEQVIENQVNR